MTQKKANLSKVSWHLIRLEASITSCMAQIDITMYYYIPYYAENLERWHFSHCGDESRRCVTDDDIPGLRGE